MQSEKRKKLEARLEACTRGVQELQVRPCSSPLLPPHSLPPRHPNPQVEIRASAKASPHLKELLAWEERPTPYPRHSHPTHTQA